MATACVASSGFKGNGEVEGALSPQQDCIMELNIEVHNCQDFTLWMLPKVTTQMLRESVGKLYVKVAYLNLEAMDSDNMIPKCDQATMYSEHGEGDWRWDKLCVHKDGALSSTHGRSLPKYRRFNRRSNTFKDELEHGSKSADPVIEEMLKYNDKLSFPVTAGYKTKLVPDLYEENKEDLERKNNGRRRLMGSWWKPAYTNPAEPYIECVDDNGKHYGHTSDAFVTESGNKYAAETRKLGQNSFALWSVGITEQKEYTYLDSQVQSLNEMTGRNALPNGILSEFSRCRLWENSQDDTWMDITDRGKPDVLFDWTNIYTRRLLAHCQDAAHVSLNNPEECCITGPAGLICYYVSGTPGNDEREGGAYDKAPHVNGNAYIERAEPCEVGFCTNGRGYKVGPGRNIGRNVLQHILYPGPLGKMPPA